MTTVICPQCGTENLSSAVNCKKCRIILSMALEHAEKKEPLQPSPGNEDMAKMVPLGKRIITAIIIGGTKRISFPIALGFSGFAAFLVSLAFWTYFRHGVGFYSYGMADALSFSEETIFVYVLNGVLILVITLIRYNSGQKKTIMGAIITGLFTSLLFLGFTLSGCRFLVSIIP